MVDGGQDFAGRVSWPTPVDEAVAPDYTTHTQATVDTSAMLGWRGRFWAALSRAGFAFGEFCLRRLVRLAVWG